MARRREVAFSARPDVAELPPARGNLLRRSLAWWRDVAPDLGAVAELDPRGLLSGDLDAEELEEHNADLQARRVARLAALGALRPAEVEELRAVVAGTSEETTPEAARAALETPWVRV